MNRMLTELDDYEVYLMGSSSKGALLDGDFANHSTDGFKCFSKIRMQNTEPLPIPNNEGLRSIDVGLQFTVIMTTSFKVYVFGDYIYGSTSNAMNNPAGNLIRVMQRTSEEGKTVELTERFTVEPLEMHCGEQFVCVRDCMDRVWYSGIASFGTTGSDCVYQFIDLNLQDQLAKHSDLTKMSKVTHFKTGGRHICLCIDGHAIFSIGANYYTQLGRVYEEQPLSGTDPIQCLKSYKFMRALWNKNGKYKVKEIGCSGNMTCILTECGKLFKTGQSSEYHGEDGSFKEILLPGVNSIYRISGLWTHILVYSDDNQIRSISDQHVIDNTIPLKFTYSCAPNELQLSRGTNSNNSFYMYYGNQLFKLYDMQKVLDTRLPILYCSVTSEVCLVFCGNGKSGKNIRQLRNNLHSCPGFHDIDIWSQNANWF